MDLRGQRFGRLLVVEQHVEANRKTVCWRCKCDCGKEIVAYQGSLRSGHTKSCGCLRVDTINALLERRRNEREEEEQYIAECKKSFGEGNVRVVEHPAPPRETGYFWIKVDEQLPRDGQSVICLARKSRYYSIHRGTFHTKKDGSGWIFFEKDLETVENVEFWIPEPYSRIPETKGEDK